MPRIEAADFGGNCNRSTGENCVNPPEGADVLSDLHDRQQTQQRHPQPGRGSRNHDCVWNFGGTHLKGTTNTFGGNSTTEFGDLLLSNYPGAGFVPVFRYNNFRRILNSNPCPA